jgi:hypothetical protein
MTDADDDPLAYTLVCTAPADVQVLLEHRDIFEQRLACMTAAHLMAWQRQHPQAAVGWQMLLAPLRPRGWVRLRAQLRAQLPQAREPMVLVFDVPDGAHVLTAGCRCRPWREWPRATARPRVTVVAGASAACLAHWQLVGRLRLIVEARDDHDDAMLWVLVPSLTAVVQDEQQRLLGFLPLCVPRAPLTSSSSSSLSATPTPNGDAAALARASPSVLRSSRGGSHMDERTRMRADLDGLDLRRRPSDGALCVSLERLDPATARVALLERGAHVLITDQEERVLVALKPEAAHSGEWIATALPPTHATAAAGSTAASASGTERRTWQPLPVVLSAALQERLLAAAATLEDGSSYSIMYPTRRLRPHE